MNKKIDRLQCKIKQSLQRTNTEEILEKRSSGSEGIVVKYNGTYYLLLDEKQSEKIRYAFGKHLCSTCDFSCGTLCPKIFDAPKDTFGLVDSKRIEKYNFIIKGVECFNSIKEYFIVSECTRYKMQPRVEETRRAVMFLNEEENEPVLSKAIIGRYRQY